MHSYTWKHGYRTKKEPCAKCNSSKLSNIITTLYAYMIDYLTDGSWKFPVFEHHIFVRIKERWAHFQVLGPAEPYSIGVHLNLECQTRGMNFYTPKFVSRKL
jgi:hypothetical protein